MVWLCCLREHYGNFIPYDNLTSGDSIPLYTSHSRLQGELQVGVTTLPLVVSAQEVSSSTGGMQRSPFLFSSSSESLF